MRSQAYDRNGPISRQEASRPDDRVGRYLVHLEYWTLKFRPLIVYPKVLLPANFIIKGFSADSLHCFKGGRVDVLKQPEGSRPSYRGVASHEGRALCMVLTLSASLACSSTYAARALMLAINCWPQLPQLPLERAGTADLNS